MILLVNGPDPELSGARDAEAPGAATFADVERMVAEVCSGYGLRVRALHSNHEGALIDFVEQHRREAKGIVLGAGALAHTSYALHDCLRSVSCPVVEVQLSNVEARARWRRRSVIAPAVTGHIAGLGVQGYRYAAEWVCKEVAARADAPAGPPADTRPASTGSPARGPVAAAAAPVPEQRSAHAAEWPAENGRGGDMDPVSVDRNARGDYEPL